MMRFYDSRARKERVTIQPGEMYITDENEIIYTVLGSCISVCFFDAKKGIAGMNHFILPKRSDGGVFSATAINGRFGEESLEKLLLEVVKRGAEKDRMTAKVFGGAAMIYKNCEKNCVSKENVEVAFAFLANQNIAVVSSDTGGLYGRRIHFDTGTGDARVKSLKESRSEMCLGMPSPEHYSPDTLLSCCTETRRLKKKD